MIVGSIIEVLGFLIAVLIVFDAVPSFFWIIYGWKM